LLILLSDIDGLYTDDPKKNDNARFISLVEKIDDDLINMGKSTSGSNVGTGGMAAKIAAAMIAANSGVDMVITNANRLENIIDILHGEEIGTLFLKHKNENFRLHEFI
jgi:glutamate 5-kinase